MIKKRLIGMVIALFGVGLSAGAVWAGIMTISPNPVEVPPTGQTKTVTYTFAITNMANIDYAYGVHGVGSPNDPNGDLPLVGAWDVTGTVFTAVYPLPSDTPTGTYFYRAQTVGNTEEAVGSLQVNPNSSQPIDVILVAPSDGQSFPAGTSIVMEATANGGIGGIQRVDFYIDPGTAQQVVVSGSFNSSVGRWSAPWNVTAGPHQIQAIAFDTVTGAGTGFANITGTLSAISVFLIKPIDGQQFGLGAPVFMEATASGGVGGIQRVDFYIDPGTPQQIIVPASFNVATGNWETSWPMISGSHQLQAIAFDNVTGAGTGLVTITEQSSVIDVVLNKPLDGQRFAVGGNVDLEATANGGAGGIQRVEFLIDPGTPQQITIGATFNSGAGKWQASWTMTAGAHQVQAIAYDTVTGAGTGFANISEAASQPFISINSPSANQTFNAGATISISGSDGDTNNATITQIDLYYVDGSGDHLITNLFNPPTNGAFNYDWTNVPGVGAVSLKAVAHDDQSSVVTSNLVPITINSISQSGITITQPVNNATFSAPASITIAGTLSPASGRTIVNVDLYYNDGTNDQFIGTLTNPTASFSYPWTGVGPLGAITLKAVATDDQNTPVTSNLVNISIVTVNNAPQLIGLLPPSAVAGAPAFTLTLNGSNFAPGAVVTWNGASRPTTFNSDSQLTAAIPASDVAAAGTALVGVSNPPPGTNLNSNTLQFTIGLQPTSGLVKAYGVFTKADLTILSPRANSFQTRQCSTANPGSCGDPGLSWSISEDAGNPGNVANVGGSLMNAQGWKFADQYIEISNVDTNDTGWLIHIYTDNTNVTGNNTGTLYLGPLKGQGSVGGMVSTSDGQFLIPLSWRLDPLPKKSGCPGWDCAPGADRVDQIPDSCSNSSIPTTRFGDFLTHFISDQEDRDTNAANFLRKTWWQFITSDPCHQALARNYVSVLNSDGAATAEYYRSPYSTLSGIGSYAVRVAAKFAPGTIRDRYQTTIYLEMVRQ